MQKAQSAIKNNGFSLVEIIIAIAIFLLFVSTIYGITIGSWQQARNATNKERATYLAEEAIEASRNIRDADFANLTDGTHGVVLSSNQFNYYGSSDATDIFTRALTISTINTNEKKLEVVVSWTDPISGNNSVTLDTYLTNWRKITPPPGITINKTVINHGGSATTLTFAPYMVGTTAVTLGVPATTTAGIYNVTETSSPSYNTTFSGDCDLSGSITLADGDAKICNITNEEKSSQLTVTKVVSGGTKTVSDFPLFVDSTPVTSGTTNIFNSGSHTVSETLDPNYTGAFSGDCNFSGIVTLVAGTIKACTLTNTLTAVVPTVTSPTATSIIGTSATLGANVTSLGIPATITARGICYGTTPNPTTNCTPEGNITTGVFTQSITGLTPGTIYYYRGYATNLTGTGYSTDGTFTTSNICNTSFVNDKFNVCYFSGITAPTGAVAAVSQFTETTVASPIGTWAGFNHDWSTGVVDSSGLSDQVSAIWRGNINFQAGSYVFHTNSDDGIQLTVTGFGNVIDNLTDHSVVQNDSVATILPAGYRNVQLRWYENGGYAVARLWWDYTPLSIPTVTTPTSTSVAFTTATLGANVTSLGIPASISARGTCWGITANPTTNCVAEGGTTTGVFTQARTGFTAGTTYYYRGYATNSTGTGYSADGTFTTSTPTQADYLTVNTSGVTLSNGDKTLSGITLTNTGGSAIVVDKITVTWTKANRTIQNLTVNGITEWKGTPAPTIGTPTGAQNSGTLLNIVNYSLSGGATNIPTTYLFSGSMKNSTIGITFTMADGSTKVVAGIGL